MFDLNGKEFKGASIFNNGKAGKVDNVTIDVQKKASDEPDTYPEYKLNIEDENGGKLNRGFYYFKPNPQKDDETNKRNERLQVQIVISIARAVMGSDYTFPSVASSQEAFDKLFKLISDNAGSKKFNVFTTFGTTGYPNKKGYMGLRYLNFIEDVEKPTGRLTPSGNDLLERLAPDSSSSSTETAAADAGGWS